MAESRVDALEDLLARINQALDAATPRELSNLSREKRIVLAELDSLSGVDEGSLIDELDRRRADRRAKAAVRAPAGGGGQQRGKRSG